MEREFNEVLVLLNTERQAILSEAQVASEHQDVELHSKYTENLITISQIIQTVLDHKESWLSSQEAGDSCVTRLHAERLHSSMTTIRDCLVSENVAKLSS